MMKDIFIFGCPRSGKTILATELHEKYGYSIISIDSVVDAFEKALPDVGIGHHNNDFKFKHFPKFVAQFYSKLKNDYPNTKFVIEGWHVLPKEISKYLDLKNFISLGIGFPNQEVSLKLKEIRDFSYKNDYCKHLDDQRIIKLIENCKSQSLRIQQECDELGIDFFDLSNNWGNIQQKIRNYIYSIS